VIASFFSLPTNELLDIPTQKESIWRRRACEITKVATILIYKRQLEMTSSK
jgi:hypothetical protein